MIIFYFTLILSYILFILLLHRGLKRLGPGHSRAKPPVAVIVPARNEEDHIEACLQHLADQKYPHNRYQIIVVDDDSSDKTKPLTIQLAQRTDRIRYLESMPLRGDITPKKAALLTGIRASSAEIIVTTDADCTMSDRWLSTMISGFNPDVAAVLSWLLIKTDHRLLAQLEFFDSFAFVAVGAAFIGLNRPVLANGANFAYRKNSFQAINGFNKIGTWGSGDDDLLLQKIAGKTENQIRFITDSNAIVYTQPCSSWRCFFRQRIRWASKSRAYRKDIKYIGTFCFIVYFTLLLGIPLHLLFGLQLWPYLLLAGTKLITDYYLIFHALKKIEKPVRLSVFVLAECLQILYLPPVAIGGMIGRYKWKERSYNKGKLSN
jgi:cellulose synthase/poly-beta-1,6-N-acetylglucosamine synthase-like glycosyltransferase